MKLQKKQFEKIRNKQKTIEVRLFDDKRKELKIGEIIEFTNLDDANEKLKVKILNLHKYNSFKDLYSNFDLSYFGYSKNTNKENLLQMIYTIYSKEDEEKYGVLGIEFELII